MFRRIYGPLLGGSKHLRRRELHHSQRVRLRHLIYEHLEDRRVMNADWRNPVNGVDVSGDGHVGPIDALLIINELNANGIHNLSAKKIPSKSYFDADGNHAVQPVDALTVINAINRRESPPLALMEGSSLTSKYDVTISVGQNFGTRRYRVQLHPSFDTTDKVSRTHDVLAVFLLNPSWTAPTSEYFITVLVCRRAILSSRD